MASFHASLAALKHTTKADSKPLEKNNEPSAFQRLVIAVDSVDYYTDEKAKDGRLSAVLLNVCFCLPYKSFLELAKLPLVAKAKSGTKLRIEIYRYLPSDGEHVTVDKANGIDYTLLAPSLNVGAGPVNFGVGEVGRKKELRYEKKVKIYLSPQCAKYDQSTILSWEFRGHKRIVYPSNIRLLVIVQAPDDQQSDFPFELCIPNELSVQTSQDRIYNKMSLSFLSRKHQGWCFAIDSVYNPHEAKQALTRYQGLGLVAAYGKARDLESANHTHPASETEPERQNIPTQSVLVGDALRIPPLTV